MICAWQELLGVLPHWLAMEIDNHVDRDKLQEIRLRLGQVPELNRGSASHWLSRVVTIEDLSAVINMASRFSPWAAASIASGYLTAQGGHRIGICGETVVVSGKVEGIRMVTSLNVRVARDFPGIAESCGRLTGSVLLLGPPGSGKTTLLRDMLRQRADTETVGVVDERGELFPVHFQRGKRVDVLTGCSKSVGIEMLLRTMGPGTVGVDEITSDHDCTALIRASWSGIALLATAHAYSVSDLLKRPAYRPLAECGLFDHIIILDRNKSWREERIGA